MADYISREAAIDAIWKPEVRPNDLIFDALRRACEEEVKHISPADVKPVVRGKWKHDGSDWKNRFICDQCGYKWFFEAEEAHFCPNCGCAMENEK